MEHPLTTLFRTYAEEPNPAIIELLNINNQPVGALYLSKLRYRNIITVSETNNAERYYLYVDGVGIYFSFYKKIKL